LALLALAGFAGAARAQVAAPDAIPYPSDATSQPVVQAWIDRYLPTQGYVIGGWSPRVVMLVSVEKLQADNYPQVVTEVFSQALTAEAANAAGWRAAVQTEVFDCERDRYQVASSLYYARADRQGGYDDVAGDGAWIAPEAGATMDTVERAACFYGRQAYTALHPPAATAKVPPDPPPVQPKPRRSHRRRPAHKTAQRPHPNAAAPGTPASASHPATATQAPAR
jgi:hypothetical protein